MNLDRGHARDETAGHGICAAGKGLREVPLADGGEGGGWLNQVNGV
jgi:hypothetical protein